MRSFMLAGLAVVLFSLTAAAQQTEAPVAPQGEEAIKTEEQETAAYRLEPTIVTPDREEIPLRNSPERATVITAEEIRRIQPTSTAEVLERVAGITVESGTGSGLLKRGVLSMNGMPANYVLVLVNGKRLLGEHIHTGQNIEAIPPEAIERIEIINTGASAQYGSDAIGGVVNIITKKNAATPTGKLYGTYGAYDHMNAGGALAAPLGDKAQFSLFADVERSDGIPLTAPKNRIGNTSYAKISLINSAVFTPAPWVTATLYGNYFDNRMDFGDDRVYSRLIMPGGDVVFKLSKEWSLTASVEYADWVAENAGEKNRLVQPQLYASWKGFDDRNLLSFGTDLRDHWFDRTALGGLKDQWLWGLFIHDRFTLSDQWVFSASLRLDLPDSLTVVVSPKAAVLYRPVPELDLRLSVGRGFHTPSLQELYEKGYGHGGTAYRFGNEELKPEYSTAFSLSADYRPLRSLELRVNGYLQIVENFITPQYEGPWSENPAVDVWRRQNLLKALVYGVESSVHWDILRWLSFDVGYGYAGNSDSDKEHDLRFSPGHSVTAALHAEYDFLPWLSAGGFFSFVGRFDRAAWNWKPATGAPRDDPNGYITELKDYQMLKLGVRVTFDKSYELSLSMANLLSQDIEHLDDALTVIEGEPLLYGNLKISY